MTTFLAECADQLIDGCKKGASDYCLAKADHSLREEDLLIVCQFVP